MASHLADLLLEKGETVIGTYRWNEDLSRLTNEDRKVAKLHFVAYINNYKEMPLFVELAKSLNISQVSFGQYMSNGPDTEQNTLLNIKSQYNNSLKKVDEASKKFGVEVFYRRFGENLGLSPKNCMFPFVQPNRH